MSLRDWFTAPLVDELRAQLEVERKRCKDLTQVIIEMRRDGFVMPSPTEQWASTEDGGFPDVIVEAMSQYDKPGGPVWDRLGTEVRKLERAELPPEEIAARILEGEPFDWTM